MMALWPQSESYTHFSTNINKENGISLAVLHRSGLHRNLKQHDHLQVEDTMIKSGLSSRNRQLQEAEADEFCCWMRAELLQSCLTLCNAMDCSRQESSVHGILRARILDWVAMPSSRGSSWPRDQTWVSYGSCIDRRVLYHQCHHWAKGRSSLASSLYNMQFSSVTQSCPTLCDPMDCSTPGLPVHHQLPEFRHFGLQ